MVTVLEYSPKSGKGVYRDEDGVLVSFRYRAFGNGKHFLGKADLKDGVLKPHETLWRRVVKAFKNQ